MSKKLIVTGGLGFIGKNFCRKFSQNYENRLIIDKLTYASDRGYYDQFLAKDWSLEVDNCKNIEKYLVDCEAYDIVHFAAESHVDNSFSNVRSFFESNVMDTLDLLEAVRKRTDKVRLLYISTDEVYGERIVSPAKETARLSPTNPYSASKTSADILVQTFMKCYGVNAKIVRANNIYGNYQLAEKLIPKCMFYAQSKKNFSIHGSKALKRHFLHTDDFTNAIEIIFNTWYACNEKIFNIAGEKSYEVREIVEAIYRMQGLSPELYIKLGRDRPFNDAEYKVDDNLIKSLGWLPKVDFWPSLEDIFLRKAYRNLPSN